MASIAPFVPSQDLGASISFYAAIGFKLSHGDHTIAIMEHEGATILIQPYWIKEWADNWMGQLRVADLDAWWARAAAGIAGRFSPAVMKPPAMQPWGLRVAFLSDPMGPLWHVTQD